MEQEQWWEYQHTTNFVRNPYKGYRDFEFAKKYQIQIKQVIQPFDYELPVDTTKWTRAYEGDGILINSSNKNGDFNNLENRTAIKKITKRLKEINAGYGTINYKLRDWGKLLSIIDNP